MWERQNKTNRGKAFTDWLRRQSFWKWATEDLIQKKKEAQNNRRTWTQTWRKKDETESRNLNKTLFGTLSFPLHSPLCVTHPHFLPPCIELCSFDWSTAMQVSIACTDHNLKRGNGEHSKQNATSPNVVNQARAKFRTVAIIARSFGSFTPRHISLKESTGKHTGMKYRCVCMYVCVYVCVCVCVCVSVFVWVCVQFTGFSVLWSKAVSLANVSLCCSAPQLLHYNSFITLLKFCISIELSTQTWFGKHLNPSIVHTAFYTDNLDVILYC